MSGNPWPRLIALYSAVSCISSILAENKMVKIKQKHFLSKVFYGGVLLSIVVTAVAAFSCHGNLVIAVLVSTMQACKKS